MYKKLKKMLALMLSVIIITGIFSDNLLNAVASGSNTMPGNGQTEELSNESNDTNTADTVSEEGSPEISVEETETVSESTDVILRNGNVESYDIQNFDSDADDFSDRGLGCLEEDPLDSASMPEAYSDLEDSAIPGSYDLSQYFPVAGDQGGQGSCVAWAVGYALKSYQEQRERGWGLTTDDHLFSPAYIYNQINNGVDKGSSISSAMNLVENKGVCTLATMPYNQFDFSTQPNAIQNAEAGKYKALTSAKVSQTNIVTEMKKQLASDNPVVIGGVKVYKDFDELNSSNPIYDNTIGSPRNGTHALCLVGYDDSKQAFKFINSWGTGWGINGYGYISYNLITQFGVYGYILTDIIDVTGISLNKTNVNIEVGSSETLVASVKPANATYKTSEWVSSNTSIATVDSNGKVTAKGVGTANITAKNVVGLSAVCTVNVTVVLDTYIKGYYANCLGRTCTADEITHWKNRINAGDGSTLVTGFFFSSEFINKNYDNSTFIDIAYKTILERSPDASGKQTYLDSLSTGMSRRYVLRCLTVSSEFKNLCSKYGIPHGSVAVTESRDKSLGVTQFIYRMYTQGLGRTPSASELNSYADKVLVNNVTGATLAQNFFMSTEFINKNLSNSEYVERLYKALLGRSSDSSGKASWLTKLANGTSRSDVLKGFVNSSEYTNVCTKAGITRGTL